MDNQPTVDRSILIPIGVGAMSIIGIIVILLVGRSLNSPAQIAGTESATPFQFVFLGTEPAIATPLFDGSEIPLTEEPIEEPIEVTPIFATPTRPAISTPIIQTLPGTLVSTPTGGIQRTNTPVRLATSTLSSPSAANTYDDTDSRIAYTGNWLSQTDVSGAYQGTLHVSDVADNKSVQFTFTGQEIRFFYQSAPSFGTVTIYFDDDPLGITLNQALGGGEWVYLLDEATSHTIEIAHTSGGSVNIDRFVIPALTPTPSRTPTPTP